MTAQQYRVQAIILELDPAERRIKLLCVETREQRGWKKTQKGSSPKTIRSDNTNTAVAIQRKKRTMGKREEGKIDMKYK